MLGHSTRAQALGKMINVTLVPLATGNLSPFLFDSSSMSAKCRVQKFPPGTLFCFGLSLRPCTGPARPQRAGLPPAVLRALTAWTLGEEPGPWGRSPDPEGGAWPLREELGP